MIWNEEKLKMLKEVNNLKKVPRYFAIKNMVEEEVEEALNDVVENSLE